MSLLAMNFLEVLGSCVLVMLGGFALIVAFVMFQVWKLRRTMQRMTIHLQPLQPGERAAASDVFVDGEVTGGGTSTKHASTSTDAGGTDDIQRPTVRRLPPQQ